MWKLWLKRVLAGMAPSQVMPSAGIGSRGRMSQMTTERGTSDRNGPVEHEGSEEARDEVEQALAPVRVALDSVSETQLAEVAHEIAKAKVVACLGAGREGLMMRALTMRLFHAGVDAHYVGDMTCPALGEEDVLLVSLGPGSLASIEAIADRARGASARVVGFTAQPELVRADLLDHVVPIDAQTMASDQGSDSVLPMGSAFEIALLVLTDLVSRRVRELAGGTAEQMRRRHTNLE